MSKPLTEFVLTRLCMEGVAGFLAEGEKSESVVHRGVSLTLSGEPVADLNYVVAGRGANEGDHFERSAARRCHAGYRSWR